MAPNAPPKRIRVAHAGHSGRHRGRNGGDEWPEAAKRTTGRNPGPELPRWWFSDRRVQRRGGAERRQQRPQAREAGRQTGGATKRPVRDRAVFAKLLSDRRPIVHAAGIENTAGTENTAAARGSPSGQCPGLPVKPFSSPAAFRLQAAAKRTGTVRGPRTCPPAQVTASGSLRWKGPIRSNQVRSATCISIRARFEPAQR